MLSFHVFQRGGWQERAKEGECVSGGRCTTVWIGRDAELGCAEGHAELFGIGRVPSPSLEFLGIMHGWVSRGVEDINAAFETSACDRIIHGGGSEGVIRLQNEKGCVYMRSCVDF